MQIGFWSGCLVLRPLSGLKAMSGHSSTALCCAGPNWIVLDMLGINWIGLNWIERDRIGLDMLGLHWVLAGHILELTRNNTT